MSEAGVSSDFYAAIETLNRLPVEQLRCHRIDADRRRVLSLPTNEAAETWSQTESELWIDIQAARPEDSREFLEPLGLHPLIMEDCMEANRRSRFSSYERSLHFELPVFTDDTIDHYLSVVCVPRILITIRTSHIPEVDGVLDDFEEQVQLNEGTKSALLHALLDALTGRLVAAATRIREEIRELSMLVDGSSTEVSIGQIIAVKRRVQEIVTIAEDQMYCVGALVSIDTDAFPLSQQRDYFRDAARNYEASMRVLHRYEARVAELHHQFVSTLHQRTESRIRTLTILSAICMPLTLIAGIYGMNFSRMPELRMSWGYPVTLATMILIAIGQLLFFHRRGWFS